MEKEDSPQPRSLHSKSDRVHLNLFTCCPRTIPTVSDILNFSTSHESFHLP